MPTSPASERDETVAQWRPDDLRRFKVAVVLGFAVAFVILAIVAAAGGHGYRTFLFVVIAMAELGVAGVSSVWSNRSRVELTSTEVIATQGRREERVPLAEVRGVIVGGTYRRGWATWLVLDHGQSVRLAAPGLVFFNRLKVYGATGTTYWRQVAESPSGRQAVLIHAAAGLDGTVASTLRTHPLRGDLTRWWSPTGESSSTTTFF